MIEVGDRVYHRRADLFGSVESREDGVAKVRYEWPHDGKELREVLVEELCPAHEAEA